MATSNNSSVESRFLETPQKWSGEHSVAICYIDGRAISRFLAALADISSVRLAFLLEHRVARLFSYFPTRQS